MGTAPGGVARGVETDLMADMFRRVPVHTCGAGGAASEYTSPGPRPDVPASIGPCQFYRLGGWIAVRCPRDLTPFMQRAGGQWEPGSRKWLIEPRRIGPLLRTLRRETDPLFRQAGLDLDG
jgi:hypothetical protein